VLMNVLDHNDMFLKLFLIYPANES
jgi:hypothetical protein